MNTLITSAEFVKGIIGSDPILTDGRRQVAFIGRSNVGKSSLINSLVQKKDLVKSGKTPGKTKEINFFLVNNKFYFVDLPGYGYAKLSPEERERIRKMILWYLEYAEVQDRKVVLVIDANVGATDFDLQMIGFLEEHDIDFVIAANKIDKINKTALGKQVAAIEERVGREIVPYSTVGRIGRTELLSAIL